MICSRLMLTNLSRLCSDNISKMIKKIKNTVFCGAILLLMIVLLWLMQCLLVPKYMSEIPEGALIAEYYNETVEHDVIFVGDCEVYENFSPIVLWEQYGISSYIRGSAQQLIWQSYYLLEDMYRYETPDVVVFNVLSMKYDEPQSEAYNRMSIDGMRLSSSKLGAIRASMTDEEDAITYIFPLLRYHSRWSEIGKEDFEYMFKRDILGHSGYLMQTGVRPVGEMPAPIPLENYEFSDVCWDYLDRMRELCEEHGSEFVLIKAPSLYPHWYEEWEEQIITYAEKYGLKYYNLLEMCDVIGIDWTVDTYDMGLHLNVSGAEKLSAYFGEILVRDFDLDDNRSNSEMALVWTDKCEKYYNEKEEKTK